MRQRILAGILLLVLCGTCADGPGAEGLSVRSFPEVQIPSMLPQEELADYVLDHFWDAYLDTTGRYFCDSTHIGGVDDRILAAQLASFLSILENSPEEKAAAVMSAFFGQVERYQAADTASNVFSWVSDAVEYYLFDPNSEIRSEELFLPFVSRLAVSPFSKEELRTRYAHAARVCATNRIGTVAPDFRFLDARGRTHTLHGEKAPWTVLLFVNPGCQACEEVVSVFESGEVKSLVKAGKLRVVGIYIDEDVAAWKDRAGQLPVHWVNGYDPAGAIRSDGLYFVRAIPSIYVLDADKRILMKDATPAAVASFIENNLT
ncbi:MAG: DUF5106 domain-containing protein [Bacteroidales bacterium]|nr:DUF5106 domain-containing protein [Bacteroidales bacterium]